MHRLRFRRSGHQSLRLRRRIRSNRPQVHRRQQPQNRSRLLRRNRRANENDQRGDVANLTDIARMTMILEARPTRWKKRSRTNNLVGDIGRDAIRQERRSMTTTAVATGTTGNRRELDTSVRRRNKIDRMDKKGTMGLSSKLLDWSITLHSLYQNLPTI